jgi:hypothetical protein
MTYPFGISEMLDERQRAELESVGVPLGHGRTRSAAGIVVGWAAHVSRLSAEHDLAPGEDRDAWNAHDYIAAMLIRGRVQRALDLLDVELRAAVTPVVTRFDDLLSSFTEPDEARLLRRFAADDADEQWWWQRIPVSGPVRAELERYAERTARS